MLKQMQILPLYSELWLSSEVHSLITMSLFLTEHVDRFVPHLQTLEFVLDAVHEADSVLLEIVGTVQCQLLNFMLILINEQ